MGSDQTRREFLLATGAAGAVLGGAALLGGCSIPLNPSFIPPEISDERVTTQGGKLEYAINLPYAIDPFFLQEISGIQIANMLFDPLVRCDYQQNKIVPAAAESWTISDDGKTFTFQLVQGAKFHNGEEVTAQDFKYSWQRLFRPPGAISNSISNHCVYLTVLQGAKAMLAGETEELSGVRVINARTLEVVLDEPFYDFIKVLSFPAFAPVPASEVEGKEDAYQYKPIGNGPFALLSPWGETSERLSFVRSNNYHNTAVPLKYVDLIFYSDSNEATEDSAGTSYEAFKIEGVDVARIPASKLGEAREAYGESLDGFTGMPRQQVITGQRASTAYLNLNIQAEPLSDPRVRRAVSCAIDRAAICNELFLDVYVPATGMVPPVLKGARDNAWPDTAFSNEEAKALLSEYEAEKGSPAGAITLLYVASAAQEKLFGMIAKNLEAVGLNVNTKKITSSEDRRAVKDEPTIGFTGWNADFPDMENFLGPMFLSDGIANQTGYKNPRFDELIVRARAMKHEAVRIAVFQYAEDMVAQDMPLIPLFNPLLSVICSDRVNDFYIAPDEVADLAKVWVTF
jgi:peptide/nickel transport system substrate-binding protein/oligopeptide transport system substrate-binding protein